MQCSFRSLCISPLHRKFPLPLPYSTLVVFTTCLGLGFDDGLKKSPTDPLRPIIPDDTCILCITTDCWPRANWCLFLRYLHYFFFKSRSSWSMSLLPPCGIASSGFHPIIVVSNPLWYYSHMQFIVVKKKKIVFKNLCVYLVIILYK